MCKGEGDCLLACSDTALRNSGTLRRVSIVISGMIFSWRAATPNCVALHLFFLQRVFRTGPTLLTTHDYFVHNDIHGPVQLHRKCALAYENGCTHVARSPLRSAVLVQAADAVAKMPPRPLSHLHTNAKAHTTRPTGSLLPIGYANRTASLERPSTESLSRIQHDVLGDSSRRGPMHFIANGMQH
eukprot:IDg15343t1